MTYDDKIVITICEDGNICLWKTDSKEINKEKTAIKYFDEQLITPDVLLEMYYIYKNHASIVSEAKATHEYILNQHICSNEKLLQELHEGYILAIYHMRDESKVIPHLVHFMVKFFQ